MSEKEQIILPDGFRKVEYLESTGSQWLTLPITTKVGDKIVLETESKFLDTSNQAEGKNGNPYFFYGISGGKWYSGAGGYSVSSMTADTEWHKFRLIHSQNDTGLYIDDIKIQSQTYNSTSTVLNGTINAYRTYNGSLYHKTRKKSWKLYINDEIVYNLIPCIDNYNIPCMYDLVSQQPFSNQGSGTFLTNESYEWNYPPLNNSYNLPAGFKKCVYLQSDGTQWIDTGVIPDDETGLYFKALQLSYGNFVPFGIEGSSNEIYPPRFNNKNLYYKWGTSAIKMMAWDKADDLIFHSSLNLYNSKIAKFDSEDTDVVTSITSQIGTYTLPIWLFSYNCKGAYDATYGKWVGRIYRAQITQGDALIHDYVPCLDANGRPCMYDIIGGRTVEDNTYYNQSGGTEFTYCVEHQLPSDFIKLKYLESSGTQYIKTGYVPTNNTGLYVDAYCAIESGTNGVQSDMPMSIRQTNGNTYFSAPRLGKTSSYQTGYGWNSFTTVGGYGDSRYEGYLNWLNNKKYNVKSPLYVEKVGNLSNLSFTPTIDLCVFGNHNYDGKYVGSGYRIYRAKISEGSEISRDFVPAYDELKQKPCMYDLINNVAYYNDGEGEFLYNRDFEGIYKGFTGLGCIGNRLGLLNLNEKIPYRFRRVAYLESSGEQFIDTKYVPTNNTGLKTIAKQISVGDLIPAGCRNDNNSESRFYSGRIALSNSAGYGWGIWNMFKNNDESQIMSTEKFTSLLNYKNNRKLRLFSTKYNFNGSLSELSFTPLNSLHIFGANINNQNQLNWKGRIYEVEISEFETVIHHFIPCLDSNNKPCMFDIITQQSFYNQGDGEDFTYGTF